MPSLMDAPDVLQKIAAYKADEVSSLKSQTSIEELRNIAAALPNPRGFTKAIKTVSKLRPALICEVKKASPSKGVIREDFHSAEIAKSYEDGGAACLSVLTDGPGFQGSTAIFSDVREATALPLLRKDFMLDPIQVTESAALGADCILVILSMVGDATAAALIDEANILGLDYLVETHDAEEVRRAVTLGANLIGINNRDLRTFETSLETFAELAPQIPDHLTLIAESGIFTVDDVARLASHGAQGFLIGESLMRQIDIECATRDLTGL